MLGTVLQSRITNRENLVLHAEERTLVLYLKKWDINADNKDIMAAMKAVIEQSRANHTIQNYYVTEFRD